MSFARHTLASKTDKSKAQTIRLKCEIGREEGREKVRERRE